MKMQIFGIWLQLSQTDNSVVGMNDWSNIKQASNLLHNLQYIPKDLNVFSILSSLIYYSSFDGLKILKCIVASNVSLVVKNWNSSLKVYHFGLLILPILNIIIETFFRHNNFLTFNGYSSLQYFWAILTK